MNPSITGIMVLGAFATMFYGIYMMHPPTAYIFAGIILFWIAASGGRTDKTNTKG